MITEDDISDLLDDDGGDAGADEKVEYTKYKILAEVTEELWLVEIIGVVRDGKSI